MLKTHDARRYDIDWLRALAFMLLIFYHIGQFYVADWGWHVKSAYLSVFLQNIMLLVNPWRMPLIFIISGIAISLVEIKVTSYQLFKMRIIRVLIPLLIGMFLIIPPQVYYELVQSEGYTAHFLEFFKLYLDTDTQRYSQHQLISNRTGLSVGLITYNHLWYLLYLFVYTLVYMAIKPLLIKINWQSLDKKISAIKILTVPFLLALFYDFAILPFFPDDTFVLLGDWYNHAFYFSAFMAGYALAKLPNVWQTIILKRKTWLVLSLISYTLVLMRFNRAWGFDIDYSNASIAIKLLINVIFSGNKIFWLLSVMSFAGAFLNKKSAKIAYINEAILPWYILHQTLIIVFAMWLSQLTLGPVVEPFLLIVFTFMGCFIGYELIKRFTITRFIFGLKINKKASKGQSIFDFKHPKHPID